MKGGHEDEGEIEGDKPLNMKPTIGALNSCLPTLMSLHQSQSGLAQEFSLVPIRGPENLADIPIFLQNNVNIPSVYEKEMEREVEREKEEEKEGGGEGGGEVDEYEKLANYEIKAREVAEDFRSKRVRLT
ncbi:hypothetical protein TrRE_jg4183 [Triparma retinervis]|uniref:Uncharacterized protein n=1 Tax=Triparma retinervis TaxID=2557542 RepID=A0A9W7A910_9STRA|nr:hypothetical protein TrRE_jg4183 [Triparma retinervis]